MVLLVFTAIALVFFTRAILEVAFLNFYRVFSIVSEFSLISRYKLDTKNFCNLYLNLYLISFYPIFKHRKKPEISDFIDFYHDNFCTSYHFHMDFRFAQFYSILLHFTRQNCTFLHSTPLYSTLLS